MSRVFVTGGTGFLGRNVVSGLVERGDTVALLVRPNEQVSGLGPAVELFRGDVLDVASIEAAAKGCSAVIHCAGKVSRDPADAEIMQRVHVDGTKNVLDACRRVGVTRAVVASTSGTVAISDDPKKIPNEDSATPMNLVARFPYYRTKLFAEMAALERNDPPAFEVVVVCPSLLLGPGDLLGSSTGDVADFIEGRLLAIPGGGLSFVDARDAAAALVLALEKGRPGERYLVAAQNLTMAAFTSKLERITGIAAPAMKLPRSTALAALGVALDKALADRLKTKPRMDKASAEMAQYFWYVDARKAKDELGWEPRDPQDTLVDTVADLRDRGVVWA